MKNHSLLSAVWTLFISFGSLKIHRDLWPWSRNPLISILSFMSLRKTSSFPPVWVDAIHQGNEFLIHFTKEVGSPRGWATVVCSLFSTLESSTYWRLLKGFFLFVGPYSQSKSSVLLWTNISSVLIKFWADKFNADNKYLIMTAEYRGIITPQGWTSERRGSIFNKLDWMRVSKRSNRLDKASLPNIFTIIQQLFRFCFGNQSVQGWNAELICLLAGVEHWHQPTLRVSVITSSS